MRPPVLPPLVVALAGLAACAPAAPGPRPGSTAQAIHQGTVDTRPEHLAVVALVGSMGSCSGTLIAPRFVLTAAHCVPSAVGKAGFGDDQSSSTMPWVPVDAVMTVLPNGEWYLGADLAVMRLQWGPPLPVTPFPALPAARALTRDDVGQVVTIVGFGLDENGNSGVKKTFDGPLVTVCPAGCTSYTSNSAVVGTATGFMDHGDSGGPWLVERDGQQYVAVVTTYQSSGSIVDFWESQLQAFMHGAPGQPCVTATDCTDGFCLQGVCCEAACAGPCMACNLPGAEGTCLPAPAGVACGAGRVCSGGVCCDSPCDGPCVACDVPGAEGTCRPVGEGHGCVDANACLGGAMCRDGVCTGTEKPCPPENECRESAGCEPATGQCRPSRPRADGSPCTAGNPCLEGSQCAAGLCVPGTPRECAPVDECHAAGSCDPRDGDCAAGAALEGTPCAGGTCVAGECRPHSGCTAAATGPGAPAWLALLALALAGGLRRREGERP